VLVRYGRSALGLLLILLIGLAGFGLWRATGPVWPALQVWPAGAKRPVLSQALVGRVIVIDPGHGGPDTGATREGVDEEDIVLSIGLLLREICRKSGLAVVMTRDTDRDLSRSGEGASLSRRKAEDLAERVALTRRSGAEVFISLHVNAIGSSQWTGCQVFYHEEGHPGGRALAQSIQTELAKVGYGRRLEHKAHPTQYILRHSPCPAANAELGFLTNPAERRLLQDSAYQAKLAWAVYVGVVRFLLEAQRPR
jgi:N-acetylmuramoyl-L-alanine amidase